MPNRENNVSRAGNIWKHVGKPGNIVSATKCFWICWETFLLPWTMFSEVGKQGNIDKKYNVSAVSVIAHYNVHLMCSAWFSINEVFFKFSRGIFHHKFHTFLPQTFRHSVSYPKPNVSFFRYSTTVNCSTFRTTVVLSSTFRTKTCATLQNIKECNSSLNILHM